MSNSPYRPRHARTPEPSQIGLLGIALGPALVILVASVALFHVLSAPTPWAFLILAVGMALVFGIMGAVAEIHDRRDR